LNSIYKSQTIACYLPAAYLLHRIPVRVKADQRADF